MISIVWIYMVFISNNRFIVWNNRTELSYENFKAIADKSVHYEGNTTSIMEYSTSLFEKKLIIFSKSMFDTEKS
jgi:hypothetical protein